MSENVRWYVLQALETITGIVAALGLGGFAHSLAARDTIEDMIAGLIILIDQPFRVGDRIEIAGLGTWGDVTTIGMRTTSIRTRDNHMVIVPNSSIVHHSRSEHGGISQLNS
jgi:small conductance mechanosensitive channel